MARAKAKDGATKKPAAPRKRKVKAEPGSVGLTADEIGSAAPPAAIGDLGHTVEAAGGHVEPPGTAAREQGE